MKRAVSTVSAPVEAQLEATVKTHIVVKNIRGIIDDAKSGNFDQEIVRVESKPMPMQTIHYKGSHQHQMMKFGVEISKIEGLHHCTIYSDMIRPYVKNESEKGIQIKEGIIWCEWNRNPETERNVGFHYHSGNLTKRIEREYLEPDTKIIKPLGSYEELRSCIDTNGDFLKIHFSITVSSKREYLEPSDMVTSTLKQKCTSNLANDIHAFQEKGGEFADITLICDEKRFPAHRAILAARSDVFAANFQHHNTKEAATDEVNIDDTDPVTLKRFLRYLYGGDLPLCLTFEDADCLMNLSHKYHVRGLEEICQCFLIKEMTIDNLYRAAILGHLYNDEILKDAAMQKLITSGMGVKEIEGWKELKAYPELSFEIFDFYSQSMKSGSCQPPSPKRCKISVDL